MLAARKRLPFVFRALASPRVAGITSYLSSRVARVGGVSPACVLSVRRGLSSRESTLGRTSVNASVIEFKLPDIGEGIAEVEVLEWYVKPGQSIEEFDNVCKVQSDKATVDITSRYTGVIKELKHAVGAMAKVGEPLFIVQLAAGAVTPSVPTPQTQTATAPAPVTAAADAPPTSGARALASPAVRRLAKEYGVNLALVRPSGPKGNVTKEDVLNFIQAAKAGTAPSATVAHGQSASPTAVVTPVAPATAQDRVVNITGIQRVMVKTMTAANAVPTLGFADEIVVDELIRLREQLKPVASKEGIKLSYMPFMIKAASLALRKFPGLNAHVNADCTQLTERAAHNIGLAMDTPQGLLVPNIKNVQDRSLLDVARELGRLANLGKEGKLSPEDLRGGTFTLSNIGTIGGTYTSPILVVPEVVIGGIGKMQLLPRFDAKMQVVPTTVMVVSWSADHRVVDGATIARFSNLFKRYLEQPALMLAETR